MEYRPRMLLAGTSSYSGYFSKAPDDASREALMLSIGFPKTVADEINSLVQQMRESEPVRKIIKQFWSDFDSLISPGYKE